MHLAETSLVKKYENDIGGEISSIGGEVTHDSHWLPYLDDTIKGQLVGDFIIDEKIDKKLDERGVSEDNIDAWNQALIDMGLLEGRVTTLENKPAASIEQSDIDAWDQALIDMGLLEGRVEAIEGSPALSIQQNDIDVWNISSYWKEKNGN